MESPSEFSPVLLGSADPLSDYLRERQVEHGLSARLQGLGVSERGFFEQLVTRLRPSANFLRDVLDLVEQIAGKERIQLAALTAELGETSAMQEESRLGPKDRQRELKKCLERRRFPETARIETALVERQRGLAKDTGLRVQYPDDLEGDSLTLTLQFSSSQKLGEMSRAIEQLAADPRLEEMFSLLKGRL